MKITVCETPDILGAKAAGEAKAAINAAIKKNGGARIILSTGASQFATLEALAKQGVEWGKVEMFHLDEYIGIDESHPASFRKYLKERFISNVGLKEFYLVDGTEDNIKFISGKLAEKTADLGIIGIGENAHIAFNDPPCDFETEDCYITVTLNEACRRQQVGEGWFPSFEDVPAQAVSMSCRQIMKCEKIISAVPFAVKAKAVCDTLTQPVTNRIPATLLKTHPDWSLYIDKDSAKLIFPK
ncbi:MAG: 6-phosphogluconolactonase [Oscillospiraceae bacterium]|nr:6-phosphogluconolactonase [Oscillospiraceae bacterium]